jgi:glycosyltransferase involved in cell wall biosynthesis
MYPEASLTLVGGGAEEPKLRAVASELRLRNLTFTGRVAPHEIAAFYADHDIYIQTPNIDNMPASVLEAFASGLPVVSTEAGGVPAILEHGKDGLLAPLDDDEAVAAHVLRLLSDAEWARSLAASGHATLQNYTWTDVRGRWLALYRELLPQSAAGAATVEA